MNRNGTYAPETNIMFQIINHKTGCRTPAAKATLGDLRDFVQDKLDNGFDVKATDEAHDYFKDFILIVSDDIEGSMLVSDFPLFHIENFVKATDFIRHNEVQHG